MAKESREYISYLLRLWKVSGAGLPVWRASLEDVHTGERLGFADLQGLLKFLEEQYSANPAHLPAQTSRET